MRRTRRITRIVVSTVVGLVLAASPGMGNALSPQAGFGYHDCGSNADPFRLESLSVRPDPPQPGHRLVARVRFRLTRTVWKGATTDVAVKLGPITLFQHQYALDDQLRKASPPREFPMRPGSYDETFTINLPRLIPKLSFTAALRAHTVDHRNLACLDFTIDFSRK